MRVEQSVEINRPVEEVFSYAADPDHYPEWSAIVLEVQKEKPGPLTQGGGSQLLASSWAAGWRHPSRLRSTNSLGTTRTRALAALSR